MEGSEETTGHSLSIPRENECDLLVLLKDGDVLILLGANGSGKSYLISHLFNQQRSNSRKISAHRQTWMSSNRPKNTVESAESMLVHLSSHDYDFKSRYSDGYSDFRVDYTILRVIEFVNATARRIESYLRNGDEEGLQKEKDTPSLIESVNNLFQNSNILISLSVSDDARIFAQKEGGEQFSIEQLSDGERGALLIAFDILTASPGTLFLIDEPERHLHRSISSRLVSQLTSYRDDCSFVISTHDHELPLSFANAQILLLRSLNLDQPLSPCWRFNSISPKDSINDELKRDLIGSRQRILFVEGNENSLDKSLYELIFPMATIIPKGNRRAVENSVSAFRNCGTLHWAHCYGIVDGDGRNLINDEALTSKYIYSLPYYSVESLYIHPTVIKMVAENHVFVRDFDASKIIIDAKNSVLKAINDNIDRLCRFSAKRIVRNFVYEQIPNDDLLLEKQDHLLVTNSTEIISTCRNSIQQAIDNEDLETLLRLCPVHETNAISEICKLLQFSDKKHYYGSARKLLPLNIDILNSIRAMFNDLHDVLSQLD